MSNSLFYGAPRLAHPLRDFTTAELERDLESDKLDAAKRAEIEAELTYRAAKRMTKQQIAAEQARLEGIVDAARVADDRLAVVAASTVLSAFIMQHNPPKRSGYASRAGKRQAAERRAAR